MATWRQQAIFPVSSIDLCPFLDSGRKQENPERTGIEPTTRRNEAAEPTMWSNTNSNSLLDHYMEGMQPLKVKFTLFFIVPLISSLGALAQHNKESTSAQFIKLRSTSLILSCPEIPPRPSPGLTATNLKVE